MFLRNSIGEDGWYKIMEKNSVDGISFLDPMYFRHFLSRKLKQVLYYPCVFVRYVCHKSFLQQQWTSRLCVFSMLVSPS